LLTGAHLADDIVSAKQPELAADGAISSSLFAVVQIANRGTEPLPSVPMQPFSPDVADVADMLRIILPRDAVGPKRSLHAGIMDRRKIFPGKPTGRTPL
jgi:hypothetical protein